MLRNRSETIHRHTNALMEDISGSSMVEMALCSMVVFLSILGVMECSRALYVDHSISTLAADAARYAMVRGSSWGTGNSCTSATIVSCDATSGQITSYIQSILPPGISSSSLIVNTTWSSIIGTTCDPTQGGNSPGCTVQVQLTYPFTFLLPLPSSAAFNFSSTASMTITQ